MLEHWIVFSVPFRQMLYVRARKIAWPLNSLQCSIKGSLKDQDQRCGSRFGCGSKSDIWKPKKPLKKDKKRQIQRARCSLWWAGNSKLWKEKNNIFWRKFLFWNFCVDFFVTTYLFSNFYYFLQFCRVNHHSSFLLEVLLYLRKNFYSSCSVRSVCFVTQTILLLFFFLIRF